MSRHAFLKRIERQGWGETLFYDWRRRPDGEPDPNFVLNQPGYENASVLVAGNNFGSGSSREHAVWALRQYGFVAVISPGFADIFHKNCFENGLVPVIIPEEKARELIRRAKEGPACQLTVDLETLRDLRRPRVSQLVRHPSRPRDPRIPSPLSAERPR